jgi:hypothetical protein
MDRYLYVMIDVFGTCWVVKDGDTEKVKGLPDLLRKGWRPVRETPIFQNTGTAYTLILLEREND